MTRRRLLSLFFTFSGILFLAGLLLFLSARSPDSGSPAPAISEAGSKNIQQPASTGPTPTIPIAGANRPTPAQPAAGPGADRAHFNKITRDVVRHATRGEPFTLRLNDEDPVRARFAPMPLITEDFQLSLGAEEEFASSVAAFSGKIMLENGQTGPGINMVVVNDAVSLSFGRPDGDYLVSLDTETGRTTARKLVPPHPEAGSDPRHACSVRDGMSHFRASPQAGSEPERVSARFAMARDGSAPETEPVSAARDGWEGNWVDHQHFRLGPLYDAGLLDMTLLFVLDKDATGSDSSRFDDKAADFMSYAARTADAYERQLGLRVLLMEVILIPDSHAYTSPGTSLSEFSGWLSIYRPQHRYNWGHATRWGKVRDGDGSLDFGSVIGRAYISSYGGRYGLSENEPNYTFSVFSHELGHNVGASHTSGGMMNGQLRIGNESFFTFTNNATDTAAKRVYDHMRNSNRVYGSANLRHPEEMPFGDEDNVSTGKDEPVSFAPLANDDRRVPNGATNVLRLVELGALYPPTAGEAEIAGDQIIFTPAPGYEGQAWLTYTLGGDVGNNGQGWLHSADVTITVGNGGPPSLSPNLTVPAQVYKVDLNSGPFTFNPLLRTSGSGNLWVGSVDANRGPNGSSIPVGNSLHLVSARLLSGRGSLELEERSVVDATEAATGYTGRMTYTPGANELAQVVMEYTVEDSAGTRRTALVTLVPPTTFQQWIADFGLSGSDAQAGADPNQNFIANLLEFARNANPTVSHGAPEAAEVTLRQYPSPDDNTVIVGEPQTYLRITYKRRAGGSGLTGVNYSVDGIRYRVEVADSITGPWRHGTDVVQSMGLPEPNPDGTETVTVRSRTPLENDSDSGYIRLRVDGVE